MLNITDKTKCCGCSACMNMCPKAAITMQEDEYGFRYPVVDKDKCINCGLCEKVCPILSNKKEQEKEIVAYACYNKNIDERLNSSSGGIFILLAKTIIEKNGVVFGASFDDNFNVEHTYVDNINDLKKFMGSKYVQSNMKDSYKKVKEFLDKDRYVLFTGTPCQIEGLKAYLIKDYDKLYTQDIICHGVPSPKVWNKYLKYRKNISGENIKSISFRNKDKGWVHFRMKFQYDKSTYSESLSNDLYLKLFLQNLSLRDSCYNCSFKKKYRNSDVTIADYWGINNVHKNMNDDKGTSLLIINTDKGDELFNLIKEKLVYKKTNFDEAISYNSAMTSSVNMNPNRYKFMNELDTTEFGVLTKKYVSKDSFIKKVLRKIKKMI